MKKIKKKQKEKKIKIKKEDCDFNNLFESNPTKLEFLEDLPIKIGDSCQENNGICLFKSIDNILVLSYLMSLFKSEIVSYNIVDKKIIHTIKGFDGKSAHIKHYLDKNNKTDLLLQIVSGHEEFKILNNIYIWNFNNLECIFHLEKIYKEGLIYSASLLKENNQFYLITSNTEGKDLSYPLKVFDLKGNKVKEIKNIKSNVNYMDIYYDINLKKNFIIVIDGTLSSYDYTNHKLYKKYTDKKGDLYGDTVIINSEKKPVKIMICDFNGEIGIYNFYTGDLLFKDRAGGYGFCYWNENYIFASQNHYRFALINISSPKIKKYFNAHEDQVDKIIKLIHPKYGECLITIDQYKTKLWIIKNEEYPRKK